MKLSFSRIPWLLLSLSLAACTGDEKIEDPEDGSDGGSDGGDGGGDGSDGGDGGTDGTDGGGGEPGDELASAEPLELDENGAASASDEIGEAGDRDFYAVELAAGEFLWAITQAYALDEDAEPDTVLRLYNEAGELLAENDDMPYRLMETDSILAFQAETDAVYYLEVLEWSDWAGEDPLGGSSYDYNLVVFLGAESDTEDVNDDPETLQAWVDEGNAQYFIDPVAETHLVVVGSMDKENDVDLFSYSVSPYDPETDSVDYDLIYTSFALFPTYLGNLNPQVRLIDGDGETISMARGMDAVYGLDLYSATGGWALVEDVAVMAPMTPDDPYFFEITDVDGTYGDGTGYFGIIAGYYDTLAPIVIDADNEVTSLGGTLELTEFTDGGGYYGRVGGMLSTSDLLDSYAVNASEAGGSLDGKYLSVFVMATHVGSQLDAMVTIYDEDGETVLATTSTNALGGYDPILVDEMLGDSSRVFVAVEPEGTSGLSSDELSNHYYVVAVVSDEPQF